ncbi:MAG TPA: NAD(+) diphosphatase, partial [Clostridiales bacterium]|nr:NAD(+) diphosphatase [Clostridiales bacterium]
MINDIFPEKLDNAYKNVPPTEDSVVCVFNDKGEILLKIGENG